MKGIESIKEGIEATLVEIGSFLFISELKLNYDNIVVDEESLMLPSIEDFAPKEHIFAHIATEHAEKNSREIVWAQFLGNTAVFLLK